MTQYTRLTEALFGLQLDPRIRAVRLAGTLYTLGAATLLASDSFLPAPVHHDAVLVVALIALVSTVVLLALPWRSFPQWTTALPLVWGVAMIAAVGAWGGALSHFTVFYGLASLYVGLTQQRGSWVWFAPLTLTSVAVALLGAEPTNRAVDLVGAAALAVVLGEVLAGAMTRSTQAGRSTKALLEGVTGLHSAQNELTAADAVAGMAHELLQADGVIVLLAATRGSQLYVNRGQRGIEAPLGTLVVDTTGRHAVNLAVTKGRPLLVAQAHHSPLLAQSVIARMGWASVLFVPVPGEGNHLGCVVVGWNTTKERLTRADDQVVALLGDHAGPLLDRLRNVHVLERQARTDPLTGLANRRTFLEALDRLRPGGAVVFLDLDHFKVLNDTQGHQAGDEVLARFAIALRASVRDGDCAARYGGEEFALVLPSAAAADMSEAATVVIDRLRERWDGPVTFSVGIAVHRAGDPTSTTLARADAALYAAKAGGRNTLVFA
ncbi:MAG: sensor domain-containing diguanylate cyclase [Mycobacteriales bacterium]